MKLFVSGVIHHPSSSDFSWTNPGEILIIGYQCSTKERRAACGCDRSMIGIDSLKGTTAIRIADVDITKKKLAELIFDSWQRGGWHMFRQGHAMTWAGELIREASRFDVGDLVARGEAGFRRREESHGRVQ